MATIAELIVRASVDNRDLNRRFAESTRRAQAFADTLGNIGTRLTVGLTLPLVAAGAGIFTAAARMESLNLGLKRVAGSTEEASRQLTRLTQIARAPGIGFQEAIAGSVRLQSVGFSAAFAERNLREFANAIASTGGGREELTRVITQLSQLSAKGRVLTQDLRPIIEAGPAVAQALLKAFGTVNAEDIEKLGLSTEEFLTKLLDVMEEMPRAAGGLANAFQNLKDSLFIAFAGVGEGQVAPLTKLINALEERVAVLSRAFAALPASTQQAVFILGGLLALMGPLALGISAVTRVMITLRAVTIAMTAGVAALKGGAALGGLMAMVTPGGALLVGLGLLASLFVAAKLEAIEFARIMKQNADNYIDQVARMSDAEAKAALTAKNLQIARLQATQAFLQDRLAHQAALANLPGDPERSFRGVLRRMSLSTRGIRATPTTTESETTRLQGLITNVGEALGQAREQLTALGAEVTSRTQAMGNNFGSAATEAGKVGNALSDINAELREFALASRFGRTSVAGLPDSLREVFAASEDVRSRIDSLSENLGKLGAAAPPQGFVYLASLREELKRTEALVDEVARSLLNVTARPAGAGEPFNRMLRSLTPSPQQSRASLFEGDLSPALTRTQAALSALAEVGFQVRESFRAVGAQVLDFGRSQLQNAISGFTSLIAQLTPAGLAASALATATDALRPVIEALLVPVAIVGKVFAAGLIPILQLLFPVIKAVGIVFTYLQEITYRVIGAVVGGFGFLLKALGKFINAITPFSNPGNPLVRAGEFMERTASGFLDAAREAARARDELRDLSWEDALSRGTEAMNRLTESVVNAVEGFKANRLRFNATDASQVSTILPPTSPVTSGQAGQVTQISGFSMPVSIVTSGDGRETYRNLWYEIQRQAAANPDFRPVAALWPQPA